MPLSSFPLVHLMTRLARAGSRVSLVCMALGAALHAPVSIAEDTEERALEALPLAEIQAFGEMFERIKRAYVEDIEDATLLKHAMRGMIDQLDPHSAYLDKAAFSRLQDSSEGRFGGVGIELGLRDGRLVVVTPIDGTPASKAGLEPGDTIVSIDGTPADNLTLQDASDLIRGDPGSELDITVIHRTDQAPRTVTLVRDDLATRSVSHDWLAPGYGLLRISQFQQPTARQARQAIAEMKKKDLLGLVLDLRNNPGGLLQSAVDVADLFLNEGLVVSTEGRMANAQVSFQASADTPAHEVPLVVLINRGSASAAEIVAGALQDQRRAVLIGSSTFGKGSVQQVIPLGNGEGLKLTTALYFTPSGRSIQAQGVEPDVSVMRGRVEIEFDSPGFREADLAGHLGNREPAPDPTSMSSRLSEDYQLGEALNLLKALNVIRQRDQSTAD